MGVSLLKRQIYTKNENPIIPEILEVARTQKLRIVNGIEAILLHYPNSQFVAFISRLSGFIQFYMKGDGHNMHIGKLDEYETPDDFFMDAAHYKKRLDDGEVIREFVMEADEEDQYVPPQQTPNSRTTEYVVINVLTSKSTILKGKEAVMEYLSCSRVSVDSVLNGKAKKTKGHYIRVLA